MVTNAGATIDEDERSEIAIAAKTAAHIDVSSGRTIEPPRHRDARINQTERASQAGARSFQGCRPPVRRHEKRHHERQSSQIFSEIVGHENTNVFWEVAWARKIANAERNTDVRAMQTFLDVNDDR
jgi:hypothetical protein